MPVRDIAGVIGRRLNVPVVAVSAEEAHAHFDWLAHFFSMDNPTSSKVTQERLRWRPAQPELLSDLDRDHYFDN